MMQPLPMATAKRFLGDGRGVAAIEFALVAPLMVLIYLGGIQLMDAISANRKVTTTVRALADLSTQSEQITPSEATEILDGARQVMTPYSTTGSVLMVVAIDIDDKKVPSITWVCARATSASCGTSYPGLQITNIPIPASLRVAGTTLLYSRLTLPYAPIVGKPFVGTFTLKDSLFMSPRRSPSVCLNTGTPSTPKCLGKTI